MMYDDFTGQ